MANGDPVAKTNAQVLGLCVGCDQPVDGYLTLRLGRCIAGNTVIVGIVQNNEVHDIAEVRLADIPMGEQ